MPCKLPSIQIDTWQTNTSKRSAHCKTCSAASLARIICRNNNDLLVQSAVRGARTLHDFVDSIARVRQPLHVFTNSGQLYMHAGWRIRFHDMSAELQHHVLHLHDPESLQASFKAEFCDKQVTDSILQFIGPARAEGVRCLLLQHS